MNAYINVSLELNERTLKFLKEEGYILFAKKGQNPLQQIAKNIIQPIKETTLTDKVQHLIKDSEESEPKIIKPEEQTQLEEFEANFGEFVRLRHGAFKVANVREWFDNHGFDFYENHYATIRKKLIKNNLLMVVNPESPVNQRSYIKTSEVEALQEEERRREEQQKEPEKKKETVMVRLDPAPF